MQLLSAIVHFSGSAGVLYYTFECADTFAYSQVPHVQYRYGQNRQDTGQTPLSLPHHAATHCNTLQHTATHFNTL